MNTSDFDRARIPEIRGMLADPALCEVVRTLQTVGIPVAPLKGVLWRKTLYAGEEPLRPISDVDLLVPTHQFRAAQQALLEAGMQALTSARCPWERTFVHPRVPVPIDLHGMLMPPGRYRLDVDAMFARAHPDSALFGEAVWILDAVDQLVHLLVHYVCGHRPIAPKDREDLARIVLRLRPDPQVFAERARQTGTTRTARLGLARLATPSTRAFSARALAAMRPDPVGRIVTALSRLALEHSDPASRTATLAAHLCAQSVPAGAAGLLATAYWKFTGAHGPD